MLVRRFVLCGIAVLLVLGPCLGFAAGDLALQIWNKHPRHASGHHAEAPHFVWKTTPGTITPEPAVIVAAVVGPLVADVALLAVSAVSRPPFVPPRA